METARLRVAGAVVSQSLLLARGHPHTLPETCALSLGRGFLWEVPFTHHTIPSASPDDPERGPKLPSTHGVRSAIILTSVAGLQRRTVLPLLFTVRETRERAKGLLPGSHCTSPENLVAP